MKRIGVRLPKEKGGQIGPPFFEEKTDATGCHKVISCVFTPLTLFSVPIILKKKQRSEFHEENVYCCNGPGSDSLRLR